MKAIAKLDEGIFKNHCILEIFRSQGTIMARLEKCGNPIAFGEGGDLSVALEKANVAYLKLFDKYAAQIARYDLAITNSNKYGNLTTFIKNGGGRLHIKRQKGFSPILVAIARDWDGNIVYEKSAPDLVSLLRKLEFLFY